MLQLFLLTLGIFALTKGEIQATPKRKITAKAARVIGIIFVVCGLLPFLLPGLQLVFFLIALIAAVVGIVKAYKSGSADITMDQKEKDKTKRHTLSLIFTGVLLSMLLVLNFFGAKFGLSQEVITVIFFVVICLIVIVQVVLR